MWSCSWQQFTNSSGISVTPPQVQSSIQFQSFYLYGVFLAAQPVTINHCSCVWRWSLHRLSQLSLGTFISFYCPHVVCATSATYAFVLKFSRKKKKKRQQQHHWPTEYNFRLAAFRSSMLTQHFSNIILFMAFC